MPAHALAKSQNYVRRRILILVFGVVFGLAGAGVGIATSTPHPTNSPAPEAGSDGPGPASEPTAAPTAPPPPKPEPDPVPEPADITIAAAGDILTHMPLLHSAAVGDDYDMSGLWHRLDEWIGGSDLALCHMEVPIAPAGTSPSGYPMFAAPQSLARDVAAQGWSGCSTASNHSVDRGFAGIEYTLDSLEEAGLGASGTARTEAEANSPQIYEVERADRTVKIAHLATTYGLNGLPKPEGMPWAVETFDAEDVDLDRLLEQAREAREAGADLIVASIHCCVEYVESPTPAQELVMQTLADSGEIDLVFGHHAHVPQPINLLEGGPHGEGMWVVYGLGNYISNQSSECCVSETSNGLVAFATVSIPPSGPLQVTDMEWLAVTVDRAGGHQLYPLTSNSEPLGHLGVSEVEKRYSQVADAVGTAATEIPDPPTPSGPRAKPLPRSN